MNTTIHALRQRVDILKADLQRAESDLALVVGSCRHTWGNVIADHVYHEAYEIPGDPPGTMGIDWRGPVWVDAKTDYRWKRVCSTCGEVQYTTRTKEEVTKTPTFD